MEFDPIERSPAYRVLKDAEGEMPNAIRAYLGLGSSLGERAANLREALKRLETFGLGLRVVEVSPIYQSPHMGWEPGDEAKYPPHLNCVALIETTLTPEELLARIRAVEEAGGRQRQQKWGPRTIDIDILLYGDLMRHSTDLPLPHPGLAERAFVVLPLYDLAPDLRLPDGRTLAELRMSQPIQPQSITRFEEAGTLP